MADKRRTPARKTRSASAKGSEGKPEEFDMKTLGREAAEQMRLNKGRIDAGESFASGRRRGPEGSPSANRNRWYG